ncbi:hypothetical protein SNARM312S_01746 [Streptomyces narbonensis]
MVGDQDRPAQRVGVEPGQGYAVELDRALGGVLLAGQAEQQVGGGRRVPGDDAGQPAGGQVEVHPAQGAERHPAQREVSGGRVGRDGVAALDGDGRGQHLRDAPGGGPPLGDLGVDVREELERSEEELRQTHGGHQLADADAAVHGEVGPHQADHGDEDARQGEDRALVPGPAAGRAQGGGQRVLARGAVAGDGRGLGAHALEDAQPRDEVRRDARGVGGALLLGLAAPLQRAADAVPEPEQRRDAEEDEQTERDGDPEQGDGADDEGGDRRHPVRDGGRDRADPAGVVGGDAGQGAGEPVRLGAAPGVEDARGQLQAEPVRGLLAGALGDPRARAIARGEDEEEGREDDEPAQQGRGGAGRHGRVDDDTDDDRDQGLAALVGHAEQGSRDDAGALPSDRSTEDNCPCRYGRWHVTPPRRRVNG